LEQVEPAAHQAATCHRLPVYPWSDGVRGRARTPEEARGVNEKGAPMTGSRLIGIVVAVAAIGAVAYFVFPGIRATIDDAYDKHAGWTPEARKKDPVGFINHSIEKLDANIAKFEDIRIEVRTGKANLEKMKGENEQKIKFNSNQLAEFKAAFKTASDANKWPVDVAGRKYSENELRSQVELFLSEKETFANVATQLEQSCKSMESKEFELVNRITDSKSKLALLKTQKEIVRANELTAESEKLLAEVNDVLVRNEAVNEPEKIRTTEEMMKEAKAATKATPKADEFLKS
jgi:hypothetical protein